MTTGEGLLSVPTPVAAFDSIDPKRTIASPGMVGLDEPSTGLRSCNDCVLRPWLKGSAVPEEELARYEVHGMQPVLAVRDMRETLAYYRDILGFHVDLVAGDPPAHARVCTRANYTPPTVFIRFEPLPAGAAPNPSVWLWLDVGAELDGLFDLYAARGVKVLEAPVDRPWGLRQFVIEDCNGYTLAFSAEIQSGA